jgi:hypothetical protein
MFLTRFMTDDGIEYRGSSVTIPEYMFLTKEMKVHEYIVWLTPADK